MNLFIAGGTGAIGRVLVPLLVNAGHKVVALTRSADRTSQLEQMGAVPDGQRVLVKHSTDDYSFEGQYVTNGASFQPERFFAGHAMSLLFAVIVGLVGARGLSWLQARLWRAPRSTTNS